MVITEKKGDITFYENEKGKMFQQIKNGEVFPVKDGKIAYKHIQSMGKYSLKYNTNGVYGFTVFKGTMLLEDRFWFMEEAVSCLKRFNDMDKKVPLTEQIHSASSRTKNLTCSVNETEEHQL